MFGKVFADAGHRAAGTNPEYDCIDVAVHLFEYFRRRRVLVRQRVVRVTELIDEVRALLIGDRPAQVLVILGVASADVRTRQDDFGAHGAQIEDLLLAHFVRQNQNQLVALLGRNQRQSEARIAGRGLNQRVAWLDVASFFRLLDHRYSDTILDGTAWIHQFEFQKQATRAGIDLFDLEHRRSADHV